MCLLGNGKTHLKDEQTDKPKRHKVTHLTINLGGSFISGVIFFQTGEFLFDGRISGAFLLQQFLKFLVFVLQRGFFRPELLQRRREGARVFRAFLLQRTV